MVSIAVANRLLLPHVCCHRFLEFFDGFFSPLYQWLFGFKVYGLGFLTTMLFVVGVGGETCWGGCRALLIVF